MKSFSSFAKTKPKAVDLPQGDLVETSLLEPDRPLPLVVRPSVPDVDLAEWAADHRDLVQRKLLEHGAILFRGFDLGSTTRFEQTAEVITPDLADDNGELPRSNVSGKIYSVSYAPPDQPILWHSENSFCPRWPMKLWFYCDLPAETGGETPIADNRLVLERLDPKTREKFRTGIVYMRNYGRGLDFTWQTAFQTEDRDEVEARCREAGIELEWREGDVLRTRSHRPAIVRHPATGEEVFFAQPALWHVNSSPKDVRDAMLTFFRLDEVPRHCAFGDGSPIDDETMAGIAEVYRQTEVAFPWQKGDALLIDNMLTAHARNPFSGPRKIFAAMAEQIDDRQLPA